MSFWLAIGVLAAGALLAIAELGLLGWPASGIWSWGAMLAALGAGVALAHRDVITQPEDA